MVDFMRTFQCERYRSSDSLNGGGCQQDNHEEDKPLQLRDR